MTRDLITAWLDVLGVLAGALLLLCGGRVAVILAMQALAV